MLLVFNINHYYCRIYIGTPHLNHLLHQDLHLRSLICKASLDERIVDQYDIYHYLISAAAVIFLKTVVNGNTRHHITNYSVSRQQFVVAEEFDIGRRHDTVARGDVIP